VRSSAWWSSAWARLPLLRDCSATEERALLGLGLIGTLLGVTTLAPLGARPLAALIGWPLRLRGVPGDLARQNAMRNPRRTASTAAALMIGLTMVVGMGVFASSLKASFGSALTESTKADLFLSPASLQAGQFSPEASKKAAEVPGVRIVSQTGWGQARIAGGDQTFSSVDPATVDDALVLDVSAGSAGDLGTDGLLVAKATATSTAGRPATWCRWSSRRPASTSSGWPASSTARASSTRRTS
jgi:putative ABC transport system permease protein